MSACLPFYPSMFEKSEYYSIFSFSMELRRKVSPIPFLCFHLQEMIWATKQVIKILFSYWVVNSTYCVHMINIFNMHFLFSKPEKGSKHFPLFICVCLTLCLPCVMFWLTPLLPSRSLRFMNSSLVVSSV